MRSYMMNHKKSCALILAIGLFSCVACHADRGGGGYENGGGFQHNDNYNNGGSDYNDENHDIDYNSSVGFGAPGIEYVAPATSTNCSTVQQCDSNGNCIESQVCN